MTMILKTGRFSGVIRPKLRLQFNAIDNKNKLINDLLEIYFTERNQPKDLEG